MMIDRTMRLRYIPVVLFLIAFLGFGNGVFAQIQIGDDLSEIDYAHPQKYEIGGIVVEGAKYVETNNMRTIRPKS